MPCYNEAGTIITQLERVLSSPWIAEIVVVDDGSRDTTVDLVRAVTAGEPRVRLIEHSHNRGKGAALRSGFAVATSEYVIVQDADLEYDPAEYPLLLEPLEAGVADVVYGSRFVSGRPHRVLYFWHSVGNRFLTLLSNSFTDLNLTDMESCYKAFRRDVIQAIEIEEDRFGFEPEITAKVAARGLRGLRGRHLLCRADLRRGQEDRLARRRASADLRLQVFTGRPPAPSPAGLTHRCHGSSVVTGCGVCNRPTPFNALRLTWHVVLVICSTCRHQRSVVRFIGHAAAVSPGKVLDDLQTCRAPAAVPGVEQRAGRFTW